jgi:double-strand break repair protein MRE11
VTRGKGRGSTPAKRGRKAESSFVQNLFMQQDQDEDDDDDVGASNRMKKAPPQPRVS